ncbi:thioredoxin [Candidatus Amesbacteria bacterium RIFCSPHIGHO2_01_FULL_48_32]|uniref:Thioredoxin n=1 Tax=Candidatus Amesbacteria bacterium RIFCSPLOWO2_01_FULL_48_25 TaxID=1797259 RepID=A0A1F4ZDV3_9BACT|nr:MAG: thioredoxin [Candidatus Amesbacteria bacterium RIFCSPHIGHO2_01_FULL_48_32]OGD04462.1 MAG: thioredoxin [Candidatus Amesbacteria bacterium RIFCSPLOWO2_01_FULL_48_25]HJZ06175.1 thioredoxin [Patescibacteria group bacterium]
MGVAVNLTKDDFDDKVKTGWVLVDFWAEWCGPCKMAAPIIEELATQYQGRVLVAKVDVDAHPDLASRFNTMSIPTVILFKDGAEVARQVGYAGRQGYVNLLVKTG